MVYFGDTRDLIEYIYEEKPLLWNFWILIKKSQFIRLICTYNILKSQWAILNRTGDMPPYPLVLSDFRGFGPLNN